MILELSWAMSTSLQSSTSPVLQDRSVLTRRAGEQATLASITAAQEAAAVTEVSLLNFVVSDGATLVATRYVSRYDEEAASLYYAEGSAFQV